MTKSREQDTVGKQRRLRLAPQTRERMILDAAIEFFAEEGFRAETRGLADRIGVSQSLIYRYFGSKENLIERVYEKTFLSRWIPEWEETIADRSRPLRERLKKFFRSYLIAVDDRTWIRIAVHSSLQGSDLTKRYIQGPVTRLLGKIVMELRAEAGMPPTKPTQIEIELAWHLHSTAIYYLIRKYIHGTQVSLQTNEIADMMVDNFLDGVHGRIKPSPKAATPKKNATPKNSVSRTASRAKRKSPTSA